MNLLARLDALGNVVNACHPLINHGGCCVFAVMVAKELKKYGVWPRIIIADYDPDRDVENIAGVLDDVGDGSEWYKNGIWLCHLGIEFIYKGVKYHYDSEGVHPAAKCLLGYDVCRGRLRISQAEKLANNHKNWNNKFDREKIPNIQQSIDTFLSPSVPFNT